MGSTNSYYYGLFGILLLLPALCYSDDYFIRSRATFYGSPENLGTPSGACGFAEYGRTINGGAVAAVSRLYRNGTGCGACYQCRCKVPGLCTNEGVTVVVTDYGEGDNTDFILSTSAFARMAQPYKAKDLISYGVVDVEYQRVPCRYPGSNLKFKVHENSKYPGYLALIALYQGGQYDITEVELWQEDIQQWKAMRRAYGAVWDMANPPKGPLNVRFQVTSVYGQKWVMLNNVIPQNWKVGVAYDSAYQLY